MRRAVPWLVAGLGVALSAAGIAAFWVTNRAPAPGGSGWVAYAPLEAGDPVPSRAGWQVQWTGGHLLGAALLMLGLLVLAAVGGWLAGRRSTRR